LRSVDVDAPVAVIVLQVTLAFELVVLPVLHVELEQDELEVVFWASAIILPLIKAKTRMKAIVNVPLTNLVFTLTTNPPMNQGANFDPCVELKNTKAFFSPCGS